jgi:hypothetical protein
MKSVESILVTAMAAMTMLVTMPSVAADQSASQGQGDSILQKETYRLRYQFNAGETVRYQVTHMAKTKTRIKGTEENAQVHTVSDKVWQISDVSDEGDMTFVHSVDSVELTQQTGSAPELRWSSRSGEKPPIMFESVADQLNQPLSTVTINSRGQELSRKTHAGTEAQLGMGGLTIPLPEEAIPVGHSWSVPREIKARGEMGEIKVIKARDTYTLEKVQTGVATLKVRSEALTPIEQASVKAQIIQQLSNGTIRFDLDNGRFLSKQLDWDETVVGFQGPNSLMEYRARLTEEQKETPTRTAKSKP